MDKLDIILTVMIAGFGLILSIMLVIWNSLNSLKEDVKDIDRRLCRLEGAFSSKEFCAIKDERKLPKAE